MLEVFVLGLLVALAKLAHMATVTPDIGAWALGALVVLWAAAYRAAGL
jgi:paraquat-inducible protein A